MLGCWDANEKVAVWQSWRPDGLKNSRRGPNGTGGSHILVVLCSGLMTTRVPKQMPVLECIPVCAGWRLRVFKILRRFA